MKKECRNKELIYEISNLSDEARRVLLKIDYVSGACNEIVKRSVKDLFVITSDEEIVISYANVYKDILTNNGVYNSKGTNSYLQLSFPKYASQETYKKFFRSPRLAATKSNVFAGVFLISFSEWSSSNELIKFDAFQELLSYIIENKDHISFVFHVQQEFVDKEELRHVLEQYTNLISVELSALNKEQAAEFVMEKLELSSFELDASAQQTICEEFKAIGKQMSFYDLEILANNFLFELYEGDSKRKISSEHIGQIFEKVKTGLCSNKESKEKKMGF